MLLLNQRPEKTWIPTTDPVSPFAEEKRSLISWTQFSLPLNFNPFDALFIHELRKCRGSVVSCYSVRKETNAVLV